MKKILITILFLTLFTLVAMAQSLSNVGGTPVLAALLQRLIPLRPEGTVGTTSPGTASLNEQYGWGAVVASGIGTNGAGWVNFGNPWPNQGINYAHTVELSGTAMVWAVDGAARMVFIQVGGSATAGMPRIFTNTDTGFGVRLGTNTTTVTCFAANGTTLTETNVAIPNVSAVPVRYRASSANGTVNYFYALRDSADWVSLATLTNGPTTAGTAYQSVSSAVYATNVTGTNATLYVRNMWIYLE